MDGLHVCLGLHCNISNGFPLSDPADIPSLVAEGGAFRHSRSYCRPDAEPVNYEEAVRELELQYRRFLEMAGKEPRFVDNHCVSSPVFLEAIRTVADRHSVKCFLADSGDTCYVGKSWTYTICESHREDYQPQQVLKEQLRKLADGACLVMILHPGHLDDYLRAHSSLLGNRVRDLEMVCDAQLRSWLLGHVEAISFDDL